MDRNEFIKEFVRLKTLGWEICQAKCLAGEHEYPDHDVGPDIRDEGLVFFNHRQDAYDDTYSNYELPAVTWEELDDPTNVIANLLIKRGEREREAKKQQEEWRRQQYENLKKEFEA